MSLQSTDADDLAARASRHLWGHFTPLRDAAARPIIARGEGAYVEDVHGRRYLDGLSGLFVVQAGHGRAELARAAARQAETLAFFPVWGHAHEPAIELATRLAERAPGDLDRVFFTTGGSDAVESAWKLAIQYHQARGDHWRRKVISRKTAYHGTSLGALALTGVPEYRNPFEPLVPGAVKVATTNSFRCRDCSHLAGCTLRCADDIAERIEMEGPDTVAAVLLEPVQNAGGAFVPPEGYWERVREICDRFGVLLVADEVICAFGRFGHWFASERFGARPDMITFAKGATSGYVPLGGVIVSERVAAPFLEDDRVFLHGLTFGGHPVACAVGLANLELLEREDLLGRVRSNEGAFRLALDELLDLPIVADIRGAGYFWAIELVRDPITNEPFTDDECRWLLKGLVSRRLTEEGLICRTDDRGDPVVMLAPPLVSGAVEFERIEAAVRTVLTEAWTALHGP